MHVTGWVLRTDLDEPREKTLLIHPRRRQEENCPGSPCSCLLPARRCACLRGSCSCYGFVPCSWTCPSFSSPPCRCLRGSCFCLGFVLPCCWIASRDRRFGFVLFSPGLVPCWKIAFSSWGCRCLGRYRSWDRRPRAVVPRQMWLWWCLRRRVVDSCWDGAAAVVESRCGSRGLKTRGLPWGFVSTVALETWACPVPGLRDHRFHRRRPSSSSVGSGFGTTMPFRPSSRRILVFATARTTRRFAASPASFCDGSWESRPTTML
mmetsp:Transcript_18572/g.42281  ORF Transcript_18572/g.42281 Transcript_18572/m.42281 type:complete len:263 (-) Transcript_18572:64-852(-)